MYRVKENVDLEILQKYGFRIGKQYQDNRKMILDGIIDDDYMK